MNLPTSLSNNCPRLEPSSFHGIIGKICSYLTDKTEADVAAIGFQLMTMFGNALGRTAHFKVEAEEHYAKLFTVIVGKSAKARKGVSLGQAKQFFCNADHEWFDRCLTSGLSSGEGLIDSLRDPSPYHEDEADYYCEDKRSLVIETEFASVLRQNQRQGNTLTIVMRMAWDNDTLETKTKKSRNRASNTHLSLIGHITVDELLRVMTDTDYSNGFANRILWVYAERKNFLPLGKKLDEKFLEEMSDSFRKALEYGKLRGEIKRSSEANSYWVTIYSDLSQERPGLVGKVLSRAEPYVMRLALIFAAIDCSEFIEIEHLKSAHEIWNYTVESAEFIFGKSLQYPTADKILKAILESDKGLHQNEIVHKVFHGNKSKDEIDSALSFLVDKKLIKSVTTRADGNIGRNRTIWLPFESQIQIV